MRVCLAYAIVGRAVTTSIRSVSPELGKERRSTNCNNCEHRILTRRHVNLHESEYVVRQLSFHHWSKCESQAKSTKYATICTSMPSQPILELANTQRFCQVMVERISAWNGSRTGSINRRYWGVGQTIPNWIDPWHGVPIGFDRAIE